MINLHFVLFALWCKIRYILRGDIDKLENWTSCTWLIWPLWIHLKKKSLLPLWLKHYIIILAGAPQHACGGNKANADLSETGSFWDRDTPGAALDVCHNVNSHSGSEGQRKVTHPLTLQTMSQYHSHILSYTYIVSAHSQSHSVHTAHTVGIAGRWSGEPGWDQRYPYSHCPRWIK